MFTNWNLLSGNYAIHISSDEESHGTVDYVTTDCQSGSATIEAQPATHYRFTQWSDGNSDNPRSLTLTQDTVLTAHFEKDTFVVTATSIADSLGSVLGGGTYFRGDTARVYAFANGRNWFDSWNNGSTDNPLTFTVQSDITVTANFAEPPIDTTYIHDTTIVNNWIYDTTIVTDTVTLTEYVTVHDTTYIDNYIHDTTYVDIYVYDTTYIDNYIYDTTYIDNWIHDTTIVTDTLWLTQYDTVWLYDTIYIHDTVYITEQGIGDVSELNAKIYASHGQIVVEGADGNQVWLYDMTGRLLASKRDDYTTLHFDAPASGTYMIKIGSAPARKVVVIR